MRLAALASGLALAACATPKPPAWLPADGAYVAAHAGFEVRAPSGWMRRNLPPEREVLVVTRDGTPLQRIAAGSTEVGKTVGASKRTVSTGMSPQELGELVLDDIASSQADLQVVENAPATLSGRNGFRVRATYRNQNGLGIEVAIYGLLEQGRFYWLVYSAPRRRYFQLDLATFEEVVASFRLRAPLPAPKPGPSA